MAKGASLFGSSAWLIAANCLENLGLLLLNLALIKVYGPGDHGRFAFYLSLVSLLRLFADAGIGAILTKLLGQGRRSPAELLGLGAGLTALLNLPALVAIVLYPEVFTGEASRAFSWFALWFLALVIQNLAVSAFNGLQSMKSTFLVSLIFEGSKLSLIGYLLIGRPAFEDFLLRANGVLFLAALVVLALLAWTWGSRGMALPKTRPALAMAGQALILWAPAAAIAAFPQASAVLLGKGLTHRDVSYWTTILSWSMVGAVFLTPAATALFAWSARHGHGSEDVVPGLREYHRMVVAVAMGSALGMLAIGGWILRLYGPEFLALKTAFGLLVLAQLADHPRFLTVPLLTAGTRAKISLALETSRVVLALGACAIPIALGLGLAAIAAGILAVNLLFGLVRLAYIRRVLPSIPLMPYLRTLAASACCAPFLAWDLHPLTHVTGLLAVFLLFSGLRPSDFNSLASAVRRL